MSRSVAAPVADYRAVGPSLEEVVLEGLLG